MATFDLSDLEPGTIRGTNEVDVFTSGDRLAEGLYRLEGRGSGADSLTFDPLDKGRLYLDLDSGFGRILNGDNARFLLKSIEQLTGTRRDDVIRGSDDRDVIDGNGGNDLIKGRGGNDSIDGGSGSDKLYGGGGSDFIQGGNGNDRLKGDGGNDILDGGSGNDKLTGGSGDDVFVFDEDDNDGSDYEVITDFEIGGEDSDNDTIRFEDFSGRLRTGIQQELNGGNNRYVEIYENRGDTFIYYDSNGSSRGGDKFRLQLEDVDADDLNFSDHFEFI